MSDIEALMMLRERTINLARAFHKKKVEAENDYKECMELLEEIDEEIRRVIDI